MSVFTFGKIPLVHVGEDV